MPTPTTDLAAMAKQILFDSIRYSDQEILLARAYLAEHESRVAAEGAADSAVEALREARVREEALAARIAALEGALRGAKRDHEDYCSTNAPPPTLPCIPRKCGCWVGKHNATIDAALAGTPETP
jgi:hypothetical protein